jgi:hypothetical protein
MQAHDVLGDIVKGLAINRRADASGQAGSVSRVSSSGLATRFSVDGRLTLQKGIYCCKISIEW